MKVRGRELSDDEVDKRLGRQYRKMLALHEAGDCEDHPANIPSGKWPEVLRNGGKLSEDDAHERNHNAAQHTQSTERANDSALADGVPMAEAFPGFRRCAII
jgi:hypothetical protein